MENKALVLLSGGQDSTTCLAWAKKQYKEVEAIGFIYGQKHDVEIDCARLICDKFDVKYTVIDVTGSFAGIQSALLQHKQDVNAPHDLNFNLPASFVPGRNMIFLSVAMAYAYNKEINVVVTGVCQEDSSGYPDCRFDFIKEMQYAGQYALDHHAMKIVTPLMNKTKAETWKMASELNILDVIINMTHTDYNGNRQTLNEWGYGTLDNPSSRLRAAGYYTAKEKGWII